MNKHRVACAVRFRSVWKQYTLALPSSHRTGIPENLNNHRVAPSSDVRNGRH